MAKQIIYDAQAKEKILAGVTKLAEAVTMTLGPCGKNVMIDERGTVHSTKDGVTVAKAVSLKDPFENIGAAAVKEVAEKSNTNVGDGTTTSTLLAEAIYRNGLRHVSFGANASQVKAGIKAAADATVEIVKRDAKKVDSPVALKRVATVSANGDTKIGQMIADVMAKLGDDGTIRVENSSSTEMTSEIIEGMVVDQPYVSPYMVTDSGTMEANLDNPYVLIVNKKLSNIQELLPCLQSVSQSGQPLFIIADDYSEDVLGTLIMNRMRGGLSSAAIKSPSYGDFRKAVLDDIAVLCGGQVISDEAGVHLQEAVVGSVVLGQAKRVTISKSSTVIIGGGGEAVEARAESIRKQIEACDDEFAKGKLQERLAKLTSGVGVISVGADTEAERKELRDRVDDAFCASKAALRSGIVPGGGTALLKAKVELESTVPEGSDDFKLGWKILVDSLDKPMSKIVSNAGVEPAAVLERAAKSESKSMGFNVLTKADVDMVEAGIIDPAEVVINEVKNAASIASLLLMTDCIICDEPDDQRSGCGSC